MNSSSNSVIKINAINNGSWLIIHLIKDKNKIRWNQTGKIIADATLDIFNERLNGQFLSKTKKLANIFKNLWSQRPQK